MRFKAVSLALVLFCLVGTTSRADIMVGTGKIDVLSGANWNGAEFRAEDGKTTIALSESSINKVILVRQNSTVFVTRTVKEMAEKQLLPRGVVRIIREDSTLIIIE